RRGNPAQRGGRPGPPFLGSVLLAEQKNEPGRRAGTRHGHPTGKRYRAPKVEFDHEAALDFKAKQAYLSATPAACTGMQHPHPNCPAPVRRTYRNSEPIHSGAARSSKSSAGTLCAPHHPNQAEPSLKTTHSAATKKADYRDRNHVPLLQLSRRAPRGHLIMINEIKRGVNWLI
ncbi:MAG: hypothetical protein JWR21_1247, partial [Herminiimonas sp.]|nr:hypothetical protein [Herminiimonas sp.]